MMAPYPNVPVPGDVLIRIQAALEQLLDEVSYLRCSIEDCGCPSSFKISFARETLGTLEVLVNDAVELQRKEREGAKQAAKS